MQVGRFGKRRQFSKISFLWLTSEGIAIFIAELS